MSSRRLFDAATIEIRQIPIVALVQIQGTETYIKVDGVYRLAVPFVKSSGSYTRGTVSVKIGVYQP